MTNDCAIRQADFRGWNACYLENGFVRLVAVPDIGGRIMACDLGPYPFFYVEPTLAGKLFSPEENQGDGSLAAWKNYGGDKTWPAPQGWDNDQQWHGPPDPVLDTGRYTLDELSSNGQQAVVRMTSPADPRTGVQITRRFTLRRGNSRIQLDITFRNTSSKTVRWSIWDVTQITAERRTPDGRLTYDPGCVVTTRLNPDSRFPNGYNVMFGDADNPQWQADRQTGLFKAPYQWHIGKVGLDSTAGWIAFSNTSAGYAFAARAAYEPGGEYPDNGATVECWTVGAGQVGNLNFADADIYHMEVELLSPLRTLSPGATASFAIEWGVCRCPGVVTDVSSVGCIVEPLRARLIGAYAQLSGQFGVFDAGELTLNWQNERGESVASQSLGLVDPLGALLLDRVVPVPANARRVQLSVKGGDSNHLLAQTDLK